MENYYKYSYVPTGHARVQNEKHKERHTFEHITVRTPLRAFFRNSLLLASPESDFASKQNRFSIFQCKVNRRRKQGSFLNQ